MSDSPSTADTLAAAQAHLVEAFAYLEANGVAVTLEGDPLRYVVDGKVLSEGDLIALAARIMPAGSERVQ